MQYAKAFFIVMQFTIPGTHLMTDAVCESDGGVSGGLNEGLNRGLRGHRKACKPKMSQTFVLHGTVKMACIFTT